MADDPAGQIRRRLAEIAEELSALPPADFTAKHVLNTEADELRSELANLSAGDVETMKGWAERAGRKSAHASASEAAKAAIVSPGEGGPSI